MESKLFYRLHSGLYDLNFKWLEYGDSPYSYINKNDEFFTSIYLYNKEQVEDSQRLITALDKNGNKYKRPRGTGTVKDVETGINYPTMSNIVARQLVWDFDSEDINNSQKDAQALVARLGRNGIAETNIQVSFSGGKGFSITVNINESLTPDQLKNICAKTAENLSTFDERIYNPTRIFRVPLSRHNSGLFKTPLEIKELYYEVDKIKQLCQTKRYSNLDNKYGISPLPSSLAKFKALKKESKSTSPILANSISTLDFSNRVKYLTPEKWVLTQGVGFGEGERHEVFMVLAASYRATGHDAEKTYAAIKDADRRHCEIFDRERFPKDELWNNIIASVFSHNWQGGAYGPGHPILARIRAQLPSHLLKDKEVVVGNDFIFDEFKKFSVDIEKNTIKTGIKEFDKHVKLITGTSVSILGVPGSSKSTLAMNILKNTSMSGETGLFFSLDMNASLISTMMIKNITGYDIDKTFLLAKDNPKEFEEIRKRASEVYKNVGYSFKFGITPADIRDAIHEYEKLNDKKVRLVVIDYLENVAPPTNMDPSIASGIVAQHIANICADENVLGLTLMQTQKVVKPGEPIDTMRNIKGASITEQSISVGIGIHRPGQLLKYKDYDNYLVANILKNRFGPMGTFAMHFDGAKSTIRDLKPEERMGYDSLLEMIESDKQEEKEKKKDEWKKSKGWD
jgi:hypothetical protein